ncbi:MAG: glycosyltransferase [Vicinamibacteria bacterium]
MIFVTFGTQESPFPRAVELVRPLGAAEKVLIQYGSTPPSYEAAGITWVQFLSYEEMLDAGSCATAFICHAGVGSIITARALGKTPVVIPRLRRYREAVDDHQLEIASRFGERGLVLPFFEEDDLAATIARAAGSLERRPASNRLHAAIALATA